MTTSLLFALSLANLAAFFEPNVGQFGEEVLYAARSTKGMALFTETSAVDSNGVILELPRAKGARYVLRYRADGVTNYSGAVFVPRFEQLTRLEVAPGIDAMFSIDEQGSVQCDFLAREGADPAKLEILFRGVDRVFLDAKGKLTVRTMAGKNLEPTLRFFRMTDGLKKAVDVQPIVRRDGVITLAELN